LSRPGLGSDPLARGSYSCALPGHIDDRVTLARPIEDRLFFVGEACSQDQFGTAHAAFTTAVLAAERLIVVLAPAS
jgi:monoamine oxidase